MKLILVLAFTILLGIIGISESFADSPREQLESGVLPLDIVCKDTVLVIRPSGNGVSCLTSDTAEKLSVRGWIAVSGILGNNDTYKISLENLVKFVYLFENRTVSITGSILKQDIAVPMVMCPEIPERPVKIIPGYKPDRNSPYIMTDGMGNSLGLKKVSFSRENPVIPSDDDDVPGMNHTVIGTIKPTEFVPDFCDPYVLQASAYLYVHKFSKD